jgi:hypothetical protein
MRRYTEICAVRMHPPACDLVVQAHLDVFFWFARSGRVDLFGVGDHFIRLPRAVEFSQS